jgi:uncharacterized protein YdeI (YjbR/CyaY-like superfamily)
MEPDGALPFNNRNEWRRWLEKNHDEEGEVWLVLYKKHTGKDGLQLSGAVEEAICFGWIDSTLRRIDDERYMLRFSPRRKDSIWSKINKDRAERMTEEGMMTSAGLEKIENARQSGKWDSAYTSRMKPDMPEDLKGALLENREAWKNFNSFSNSHQLMYIHWINSAKREDTRKRRIREVVKRSARNEKPS